jgi:hypothetical protein
MIPGGEVALASALRRVMSQVRAPSTLRLRASREDRCSSTLRGWRVKREENFTSSASCLRAWGVAVRTAAEQRPLSARPQ